MKSISIFFKKNIVLCLIATCLSIQGCSTNVIVAGEYPPALVQILPYNAGLVLNNVFTDYSFTREKDDKKITITLGESQTELLSQIFGDMFLKVSRFQAIPQAGKNDLDLLIVPHIEKLQLSMPDETNINIFEVWIKYKLEIFDHSGILITEWFVSSYGRTQTRFLKSQEAALNQATISALRDAGTQIITGFNEIPKIRDWINQKTEPSDVN